MSDLFTSIKPVILKISFILLFFAQFAYCQTVEKNGHIAYINKAVGKTVFGNEYLELTFGSAPQGYAAKELLNKVSGRKIPLSSDNFSIGIADSQALTKADFRIEGVIQQKIESGQRLTLTMSTGKAPMSLKIIYELGDSDFFIRRRLEAYATEDIALRRVTVWSVDFEGNCWSQEDGAPQYLRDNVWDVETAKGFGLPVLMEDTFWGLEHPAGLNHYGDGKMSLSHAPGPILAGVFVSKQAVIGVSSAGGAAGQFRRYINAFRQRPDQPEIFINYNTWTTLMPPTEENALEIIDMFRENLVEPYGVAFNSFTLDDGWDDKNSLWDIRKDVFPNKFEPLIEKLNKMKINLGLWFSASSGYGHAPWGGENGYKRNVSCDGWFLCQSDPNYRRDIVTKITGLMNTYNVSFFKIDGFCASCNTDQHTHLPGDFAREANVDAFIELATAMRKAKPNVYLDPTCGTWMSPWWLKYVDSVWGEVYDGTPPALVPSITDCDGGTTIRDALFRLRYKQSPGFPSSAIEHLGIYMDSSFGNWQDNTMMIPSRGCRLLTFYMDPRRFPDPASDWPFLAHMLKWVRANADILSETDFILGDPEKREVYGYSHFKGQRGIITVRNPFLKTETISIKLDESVGLATKEAGDAGKLYVGSIVYPRTENLAALLKYGSTIELQVKPYETLILHIDPLNSDRTTLLGARYAQKEQTDSSVTYEVFARAGQNLNVSLLGAASPKNVLLNGNTVAMNKSETATDLPLAMPGESIDCSVDEKTLAVTQSQGKTKLLSSFTVEVPEKVEASVYVLCAAKSGSGNVPKCTAKLNGTDVELIVTTTKKIHHKNILKEIPLLPWSMYKIDCQPGKNDVSLTIQGENGDIDAANTEISGWLWADYDLEKAVLKVELDKTANNAISTESLPLPNRNDRQREVKKIFSNE